MAIASPGGGRVSLVGRYLTGSLTPNNQHQQILSPQLFVAGVDRAIKFLFNWSAATISKPRKMELYQHIFSYASVKTVVQWCVEWRDRAVRRAVHVRVTGIQFNQSPRQPTKHTETTTGSS